MFQIDEDMTIYVTRGDVAFFSVSAEDNGELHRFQKGDVVRIKVFEKKNCENVAFQKDFAVTEECDSVNILLTEEETKIGDVISKAKDYWYEIELNPYTNPQTIIGYDDDGAKIFKLFPEGRDLGNETREEDVPVVDSELSLTSRRPIENQAVARAILNIEGKLNESKELNGSSLEKMEKQVMDSVNKTSKEIERVDTEVAMQRSRLNNLASAEGETTDVEMELADARVDHTGNAWENVGEHIRGVTGQLSEDIDDLHETLFDTSVNMIDNKSMVSGYYTTTTDTPTITENNSLKCILVEVEEEKQYTLSSMSYSSVVYDNNYHKIMGFDVSNNPVTIVTPKNAKYLSVSAYNNFVDTLMMVKGDTLPPEFVPYKNESAMTIAKEAMTIATACVTKGKIYNVGQGQEYTNFTELIKALNGDDSEKIIYVHSGIYDIFEEYGGAEYAQSITDTEWRKWSAVIPPNTSVIGLGRVIFNFLPNGSDCTVNSVSVLSPINTSGNCTIKNITINCKNCRYGIHDETSGITDFYYAKKIFENIRVNRQANDSGLSTAYGHAYASGFDVGIDLLFDRCSFIAPALAWSIHDRPATTGNNGGNITFKNSVFDGTTYADIQFLNNNLSPSETIVNIINCKISRLRKEKNNKNSEQKNGFNISAFGCKTFNVISDFESNDDYPFVAYNEID